MRYSTYIMAAFGASVLFLSSAMAEDGVLVSLPDKRVAVISKGDLEFASIGSYTVALYKDDTLIDFIGGGVFPRDGSVFDDNGKPSVEFADITGDGNPEMIISKLTAGSGNYLDVDVLKLTDVAVERVLNFSSDTNKKIIEEAKQAYQKQGKDTKKD